MQTDKIWKQFFKRLEKVGAQIVVYGAGGDYVIDNVEDLALLLQDYDAYMAKCHNMSVKRFKAWRKFYDEEQCKGITKRGRRCRNGTPVCSPEDFVPGLSDRCDLHR